MTKSSSEIYAYESKGIYASGYVNGKIFIVQKGSQAVDDDDIVPSFFEKPLRQIKRNELISKGILVKGYGLYVFTRDVSFNSPSEAASIIWGNNISGPEVFRIVGKPPSRNHKSYYDIEDEKAVEGYNIDTKLLVKKRDSELAFKRKAKDNFTCQACGFKLKINGKAIIECHHINPIEFGTRETKMDDLVSLCPTCHRIAHMREPIYSVSEISKLIKNKKVKINISK